MAALLLLVSALRCELAACECTSDNDKNSMNYCPSTAYKSRLIYMMYMCETVLHKINDYDTTQQISGQHSTYVFESTFNSKHILQQNSYESQQQVQLSDKSFFAICYLRLPGSRSLTVMRQC